MSAQKSKSRASPPRRPLPWSLFIALVCTMTIGTVVLAQSGAIYDLHWNVLSGGGALSTGTNYRINYSFGQPSTIDRSGGGGYPAVGQGYWYGGTSPTAIKLLSFEATPHREGILVTWETSSEWDNLGFHLYRQADRSERVRVNEALIPSQVPGEGLGACYTLFDSDAAAGVAYTYFLEDVDIHGRRTMHGPVHVIAPYCGFLPLIQR